MKLFKSLPAAGLLLMALMMLVFESSAVAKKGGTDRPFRANLAGHVIFAFGEAGEEPCGDYQPGWPATVVTFTESAGTATHMGATLASWWHCPTDIGHDNGHLTLTAANGDEIFIEYTDDGTGGMSFPMDVVDGTGRFMGASGSITVNYELAPAFDEDGNLDFNSPWGWWGTLDGMISY